MGLVILILLLLGVGFWLWRYQGAARSGNGDATAKSLDIPTKVLNPAGYAGIKSVLAWEFMAPNLSQACQYARDNAGLRRSAQACQPLPNAHCNSNACLCHYRPIFDERRRQRRAEHDRRTEYRMDDKTDRRQHYDRRKDNSHWNQDLDRH